MTNLPTLMVMIVVFLGILYILRHEAFKKYSRPKPKKESDSTGLLASFNEVRKQA